GDHVLCGSYDRRVCWFDLDGGEFPYKTLKFHRRAVQSIRFHPGHYPLFASASDDGSLHVFHARVFSDLVTRPQLVPVKILRAHTVSSDGHGVLDCCWHPHQPWLLSAGADGRVLMFRE
ncbi:MAG: hypothetical protein MHM6MM_006165, partial [Cercozoa sp. M6MM]